MRGEKLQKNRFITNFFGVNEALYRSGYKSHIQSICGSPSAESRTDVLFRNLHQIYDTPILQARQTFLRKTFEKSFRAAGGAADPPLLKFAAIPAIMQDRNCIRPIRFSRGEKALCDARADGFETRYVISQGAAYSKTTPSQVAVIIW